MSSRNRRPRGGLRILLVGLLTLSLALVGGPAFAYTPPATSPFTDVKVTDPYYTEIAWMRDSGISTGWSDGTYRPKQQVDRDAMAAFFYRYKGSPAFTAPTTSPFTDITPSTQFYKEMAWMKATGISTGWDDGTYRPWIPTARDAMSAFLYRVAGSPAYTPPATSPFTDITPSTQFYKEMTWLAEKGIATSVDDGTFNPADAVTREMMAVFMYRLANPSAVALAVTTSSLPAGVVGTAYSTELKATNGTSPYTWSATGLPAGLTISTAGVISGTPTAAATSSVKVSVKDAKNATATATLSLAVTAPAALAITTASLPAGTAGAAYSSTLAGKNGTTPYTWSATGLPSGLTISTAGVISGTPTTAATSSVKVTLTDAKSATATVTLSLVVNAAPALAISSTSLPGGIVGAAYTATVTAQNGTTPYTWSATGLPTGLTISTAGVISGTPTVAGTKTVALTVTDKNGATATKSLSLAVTAAVSVVTTALPNGVAGTVYGATVSATGGKTPYTWTASGLPSGLSISSAGQISGTPGAAATSSVTVTVTDGLGAKASRTLSLTISAANNCNVLRCIAITFDDGPLSYSDTLLNAFTSAKAKASFYEVGSRVKANPAPVGRKAAAGMDIGMHGWDHVYYTNFGYGYAYYDFNAAASAIQSATGKRPTQFRPPYGYYNPTIADAAGDLGMATIMWTDNTWDYEYTSASALRADTVDMASRNSVLLMHDGYAATASAMPGIISDLQSQGYTLVTVSMLLGGTPNAGQVYFDDDPVYH